MPSNTITRSVAHCAMVSMLTLSVLSLSACGKTDSKDTPLPTKEKTIDRAQEKLDKAAESAASRMDQVDKKEEK